jgi:beta-D-xylosidase 4
LKAVADSVSFTRLAKHLLAGLEGNETQRRIIATCKHFAGNDIEKWGNVDRHNFDAKITTQDLAEYYLQPFQQCARDSKVGSFMCSYNSVNGVPACANTYLLQTVLRDHWNWTEHNNYVTSDCEAVVDISANHHYAKTNAEGTALAFNAGMDTSCEYSGSSDIPGAWKSGALNITTVDRALKRLYEGLIRAGYFDGTKAQYANLGASNVNTKEAQQLAQQAAVDGIVMLKNDNHTLPLALKSGSKVAMIGFWADDSKKLQGGYSGTAPFLHSPVYAAKQSGMTVSTASGPVLQGSNVQDTWTTNAVAAAQKSDYILYFGGLDTSAAAEGSDRTTLDWPAAQITLITKLATLGKPLVVVQMGDMVDNSPILALKGVNSILWASWPGQDGGPAVMQIITGAKAVAGRLPITQYPSNYTKVAMTDMNLRPSGSNPGRTYRWFPSPVQAFGTGLHYVPFKAEFGSSNSSSLSIQDLVSSCKNPSPDTCSIPSLSVSVTNGGNMTSDYVALAFIKGQNGPKPYPLKTLISYARLRDIASGQKKQAQLPLTLGNLARHDEAGNTVVYPGDYEIVLDEPVQSTIKLTLTGTAATLDNWPAPAK